MAGNKNHNVFYDRLARLEAESGRTRTTRQKQIHGPQKERKPRRLQQNPRKLHLGRRIMFGVLVFFLLLFGGAYLNNALPENFSAKVAQMGDNLKRSLVVQNSQTGSDSQNTLIRPAARPGIRLTQTGTSLESSPRISSIEHTYRGDVLPSPAVLATDGQKLFVTDLFADFQAGKDSSEPTNIIQYENIASCAPRRPTSDEKIMGVRLFEAQEPTQIQAFDKAEMANALLQGLRVSINFRRQIRLGEKEIRKLTYTQLGQAQGHMKSVDVILTDTSAPLYLVLQTQNGNTLWNLHLATGVKLSHVVLVSDGKAALSGLPTKASFEAMDINDFDTQPDSGSDCMIRPWRKPQPNWIAWQKAQDGNTLFTNQLATFNKGHAAYNDWYQVAFGVDASSGTLAAKSAAHVLLGPKPEKTLPYHMIGGNDLLIAQTDYLIKGDAQTRAARVTQLHSDLMHAALGGGLETLWPNAVTGVVK